MTKEQESLIENVFSKLERDKWYNTKGDENLIENLKLCHDLHDNILFSDDYSAFKKVHTMKEYIEEMDNPNGINIKFEFRKWEEVMFDYSNLPENDLKNIPKKEWDKHITKSNRENTTGIILNED